MSESLDWTGERLVTSVKAVGVVEHLHRYSLACEFVTNKIVLDIASGEGYGSNLLAKKAKKVFGVDISTEAVEHASCKYKQDNLSYKHGSVTAIPLEDSSVDVVVSFETIEHLFEQEVMFQEIKRVLKKDGLLIISSPEKQNYEDINTEENHFHVKELYFKEFKELITCYFTNYSFAFQKVVYGSLLVPAQNLNNSFTEYDGDFDNISSFDSLDKPVFNICLASDVELPTADVSFFDAGQYFIEQQNKIKELESNISSLYKNIDKVLSSKNYKIGKTLLAPLRRIKSFKK